MASEARSSRLFTSEGAGMKLFFNGALEATVAAGAGRNDLRVTGQKAGLASSPSDSNYECRFRHSAGLDRASEDLLV
jgi:hypothetical protein